MSRYEHLPIYKHSMDMVVKLENHVRNMSRYNKYGLGGELRKKSYEVLSLVIQANNAENKLEILNNLRIRLEEV